MFGLLLLFTVGNFIQNKKKNPFPGTPGRGFNKNFLFF